MQNNNTEDYDTSLNLLCLSYTPESELLFNWGSWKMPMGDIIDMCGEKFGSCWWEYEWPGLHIIYVVTGMEDPHWLQQT